MPHPFSAWSPQRALPPDGLLRVPYGIPPCWARTPQLPNRLYEWWGSGGRYMHAKESLKECLLFIKAVHPDKHHGEHHEVATVATTEANAVRDWLTVVGHNRGEL